MMVIFYNLFEETLLMFTEVSAIFNIIVFLTVHFYISFSGTASWTCINKKQLQLQSRDTAYGLDLRSCLAYCDSSEPCRSVNWYKYGGNNCLIFDTTGHDRYAVRDTSFGFCNKGRFDFFFRKQEYTGLKNTKIIHMEVFGEWLKGKTSRLWYLFV